MAVKYQIFISSTYEDLKGERDAVIRAVLEMGHIPVGMEMFSAADEEQWRIITRHIDESDYYVVIVAHRYGSITDGISYTRKEYEYALGRGVPVLGFLIDPKAAWPADRIDSDSGTQTLLADFKQRIEEKPVGYWSTSADIHSKCSIALMKAFTSSPRDGWVRASTVVGPEVTAELSRLSAENARLRDRLEAAERESEAERELALARTMAVLERNEQLISYRETVRGEWIEVDPVSLAYLFELLAPMMLVEYDVETIAKFVALHVRTGKTSNIVPLNVVSGFLSDLAALGLVEPSPRKHSVHDKNEYWTLTQMGRDLSTWTRRRRLETGSASSTTDPAESEERPTLDSD